MDSPDDQQQMQLQMLRCMTIAMGMSTVQSMLRYLAYQYNKATSEILEDIDDLSDGMDELGAQRITLPNNDVVYLVVDECSIEHDSNNSFNAIKYHYTDEGWARICAQIGLSIRTIQIAYQMVLDKHKDLFEEIVGADLEIYRSLKVDGETLTFYLNKDYERRVGYFIRRD